MERQTPCKNERWEIINDREDHDYICRGEGNYGWYCSYTDKNKCKYYVPDKGVKT